MQKSNYPYRRVTTAVNGLALLKRKLADTLEMPDGECERRAMSTLDVLARTDAHALDDVTISYGEPAEKRFGIMLATGDAICAVRNHIKRNLPDEEDALSLLAIRDLDELVETRYPEYADDLI